MKLQKKVIEGSKTTVTDYLDGYQYVDGVLEFYPHAEGYVNMKSGKPEYVYNYTDHLGNVRVSYVNEDGKAKIVEESNYYPFGLKHNGYNKVVYPIAEKYKYGYNGKELTDELGYNMLEMDMRQFDPAIARWVVQDPVVHHSMSSYTGFDNNPVFWADPSGADSETMRLQGTDGKWHTLKEGEDYETVYQAEDSGDNDGDYYDQDGNYLFSDGIDDGRVYQFNSDVNVFNLNIFNYLGKVNKVKMTFTGKANPKKLKEAIGVLNLIQVLSNGQEFIRMSFEAVGGPWGNGSPENGKYLVHTLLDRGPKGWYNKGMTKKGIGFSLNVDPLFKTGRSLLRIHPDGGKYYGTQGCIGLTCDVGGLVKFRDYTQNILASQKNISLEINILNNPNNNGYGKKVKSNGE
ncbi:hypothetical protein UJ101_02547 [Flavobacteriaceae bacterium UJ101]|nr:hypothetical protein UJ101_02547 [Flavobacteriaceae bacterium UJ101]